MHSPNAERKKILEAEIMTNRNDIAVKIHTARQIDMVDD